MQDVNVPVQPGDTEETADTAEAEARMRRALAQLGDGTSPAPGRANTRAGRTTSTTGPELTERSSGTHKQTGQEQTANRKCPKP